MKVQTIDNWNNLKSTNNNFNNISTELLGHVARQLKEQITDNKTGETKRDTGNDYLISQFFMNNITRDPARPEVIYDRRASEDFISKLNEALEEAKSKGDNERIENLNTILEVANEIQTGIEREQASNEISKWIKIGDEELLSSIKNFFNELREETSAGLKLRKAIYAYLVKSEDKNDFIKRMTVVTAELEEYKKENSGQSLSEIDLGHLKGIEQVVGLAQRDYENDDLLGK